MKLLALLAAFGVWIASAGAPQALAGAPSPQPVQLSLRPVDQQRAFFEVTLTPGESRRLQVELNNAGTQPVQVDTYAADVYTIVNGGFGARLKGEPKTGTTLWLDYEQATMQLRPLTPVVRGFTVTVPPATPPGEYISGVVLQNSTPIKGSSGININQVQRQALAVSIKVPGPDRPELGFGKAGHKVVAEKSVISVQISNPGNVHLRPRGDWRITNAAGDPVDEWKPVMDTFFAGTDTRLERPLDRLLPPGTYTARVSLSDGAKGAEESGSLRFVVRGRPGDGTSPVGAVRDAIGDGGPPSWLPLALAVAAGLVVGGLTSALVMRRRSR